MEPTIPINATCPECRGPLSVTPGTVEFSCLVGHVYSPSALLQAHYETQERTLWASVVVLEETVQLVNAVAPHCSAAAADRLQEQAAMKVKQAKEIRGVLERLQPFRPDE